MGDEQQIRMSRPNRFNAARFGAVKPALSLGHPSCLIAEAR
jgi:hypothetical protein